MNAPSTAEDFAVFTRGSTLRHVLVMTATSSIGLMAIFVVELFSVLYISWLGDPGLTAGVGFASQVMFFAVSINIGMSIGVSALVSRAIGSGQRETARQLAASGLVLTCVVSSLFAVALFPFRIALLEAIGARGSALSGATLLLDWTIPSIPLLGLGMALPGLLRCVGDARRAMYVTLFGALVVAVLDPILILGLHMGLRGAAIASNVSRVVWIGVGLWGAVGVHNMVARPLLSRVARDAGPLLRVSAPAVLTNFAAPIAMIWSVREMAHFGDAAVAAGAIIDRLAPVAFGVLFAMSGAVGPIIGQNFGAGQIARVRSTLTNCFVFSATYVCITWLVLWLLSPAVVWLFTAQGETARLVTFFCTWGASGWAFLGCLFAANAAFNNLGFAFLSTFFNWGRATIGTIPFVTLGALYYGPQGVILGSTAGASIFGTAAMVCAYRIVTRLQNNSTDRAQMS